MRRRPRGRNSCAGMASASRADCSSDWPVKNHVILSGVRPQRSAGRAESKDPCNLPRSAATQGVRPEAHRGSSLKRMWRASSRGVLRLRAHFASRSVHCAQDDSFILASSDEVVNESSFRWRRSGALRPESPSPLHSFPGRTARPASRRLGLLRADTTVHCRRATARAWRRFVLRGCCPPPWRTRMSLLWTVMAYPVWP